MPQAGSSNSNSLKYTFRFIHIVYFLISDFTNVSGDSCDFIGGGNWGRLGT